jgi:hypothetical protein
MRKALPIAAALIALPLTARADGFDFRDFYAKAKSFAEALVVPEPPQRGEPRVPSAEIDPKMALVPREEGRMRIIAPPGTAGGDRTFDPR